MKILNYCVINSHREYYPSKNSQLTSDIDSNNKDIKNEEIFGRIKPLIVIT